MPTFFEVKNLKTALSSDKGLFLPVDGLSFRLDIGQTLGLVGESGCGKSLTALSLMRLLPESGKILGGQIFLDEIDLLKIPEAEMQALRGNQMAMIFQDPMTSLNPVFTCGSQIEEPLRLHRPKLNRNELKAKAIELIRKVGLSLPEKRYHQYPHELSGGMRQRILIAMAMSCEPRLLIADEPTTALDVTVQSQILDLMKKLQKDSGAAMILITHDLGVVAKMCDQVAVMYAGKIVEVGSVVDLFSRPRHPYTQGLLLSGPRLELGKEKGPLRTIGGAVPHFQNLPPGCRFQDRCEYVQSDCRMKSPELKAMESEIHQAACFYPLPISGVSE